MHGPLRCARAPGEDGIRANLQHQRTESIRQQSDFNTFPGLKNRPQETGNINGGRCRGGGRIAHPGETRRELGSQAAGVEARPGHSRGPSLHIFGCPFGNLVCCYSACVEFWR